MGQKVNPIGLRIGVIKDWESKWYANKKEVADLLQEDIKIREAVYKYYEQLPSNREDQKGTNDHGIAKIEIKRSKTKVTLLIYTSKPGFIIGKEAANRAGLVARLEKMTGKVFFLSVVEIANPMLDATLVARNIAKQLENRASFRRVQKKAIQDAMKAGAKGIKTSISGRLGGAEMARREGYSEGTVPLHTLRADVDYAIAEANTTYGKLGVKVWICKGEVLPAKKQTKEAK